MSKQKLSLIATACTLLISMVLLVTASLAWMTISRAPEVSGLRVTLFTDQAILISKDNNPENFTQSIDLSEMFELYAPLKPISTYDGVYWFMPAYDALGSLRPPEQFLVANPDENMNVSLFEADGKTPLTGKALLDAQTKGYYVSCEFWLATELTEDVTVTLSVPDLSKGNLADWETDPDHPNNSKYDHSFKFGSYAIGSYTKDTIENDDGTTTVVARPIDNNAQTALRVGFMTDFGTDSQKFTIYEPNADERSLIQSGTVSKPTEENGYVHGYTFNTEHYKVGNYLQTFPIKVQTNADGTIKTDADGKPLGMIAQLDPDNLIVQKSSAWSAEMVDKVLAGTSENPYFPNSGDVESFGKFIKDTSALEGTDVKQLDSVEADLASTTQIVTLEGRDENGIKPKKITMYIWIEGQDPDCWNDIANGTFVLNLEFAAREITSEE